LKQLTDEELMNRVAAGELDYLRLLFDRYHTWIFNFFLQKLRDRELSEDLTQNTFYKVLKNKNSYNGGRFVSWIFQIARNLGNDHFRKVKQMQPTTALEEAGELADLPESGEQLAILQLAMQQLGESDRELLILSRFKGMKYAQIAEMMGLSEANVRIKAHRAIKRLRTLYFQTAEV
jgi:RNA polymerase sigma-70 factor (ECF subfamily)